MGNKKRLRAKKHEPPRNWLIKIILNRAGRATMRQIAWDGLRGERFQAAKDDAKGFVVFEPYAIRNGVREGQAAKLTAAGVWEAIRMSKTYDPSLIAAALAGPGIEAYLARLEKEKHPIAVKIAGYRKDAELWQNRQERDAELERKERQTIARIEKLLDKLVDKIPSKICKRDIRTLNAFLEKKGRPRIEPEYVMPGETPPSAPKIPPTEHRQQITPVTPVDDFTRDYLNMQRDLATIHEPARGFSNLPTPADVADNARIIELFHKTDYAGELLANGNILYDGVEMTPKRWKRERFKQAG